jgi:hypothetical protein
MNTKNTLVASTVKVQKSLYFSSEKNIFVDSMRRLKERKIKSLMSIRPKKNKGAFSLSVSSIEEIF